ncbi:MAG TPA: XrtA system polysaccharide deacetylase, partial [Fibrobacteria bacterium]|nr:XrtA system polysaccharide deacetylase [Fibrobacteria bacterium]
WIRMESWVFLNTFVYLLKRPTFDGDAIKDPEGLRRAKLLPFQSRAAAGPVPRSTRVTVSFDRTSRPLVLTGGSGAELAGHLEGLDFDAMPCPEVYVRPRGRIDLEDMGFLVRLAHAVKSRGGRICLRSSDWKVRRMLKEMRLDAVVEVEHASTSVKNFITVDVECWFHAYHMREVAPKCTWHLQPTRIVENVERLLELMRAHNTKGTFFILGWVADHHPEVVRMIDLEGHEIGSHGYHHDLITEMTPALFEEDLLRSLEAISRHTSQRIRGHRASNFSVVPSTLWALDIMARHGLEYDSSVFPFARGRYGIDNYPNPLPHTVQLADGRSILELPMSTIRWGKKTLPIAGGGYFRLYPRRVTEGYIEEINRKGIPAMVYLHPWEIDSAQKRHSLGLWKGFQHYVNLEQTEWKLNRLLQRFEFGSIAEGLKMSRLQTLLRRNPVPAHAVGGDHYAVARAAASRRQVEIQRQEATLPLLREAGDLVAADADLAGRKAG